MRLEDAVGFAGVIELMAKLFALDIHIGQDPVEPARQPPGGLVEQGHDGGHDGHAYDERVEEDCNAEGEADGFDERLGREDKPEKTLIMMIAAAVTTRTPWPKPETTASRGVAPCT